MSAWTIVTPERGTTGYAGVFLLAAVWSGGVQRTIANAGYFRDASTLRKICVKHSIHLPFQVGIGHLGFILKI